MAAGLVVAVLCVLAVSGHFLRGCCPCPQPGQVFSQSQSGLRHVYQWNYLQYLFLAGGGSQ